MLPDYDNAQKWLGWIRTKWVFKIWLILPIVLSGVAFFLWRQNANLKEDLYKTRNEVIPIKELYPKLELSAGVAKLIESHNQLEAEVTLAEQKKVQTRFADLAENRVAEFVGKARDLVNRHTDIEFEFQVLSVNPSNDLFRKCIELTDLLGRAGIKAKYANTMFSSKHNVVIKCSEALPRDVINEIKELLKIVFKDTLHFEFLKPGGKDTDGSILVYFLGTPSFDNEGCVFYETPVF